MSVGHWLRINGTWVSLGDVFAPGVNVEFARPGDEMISVGGVRDAQRARRAPRTWNASLAGLTGPEAVAALMVAAQGDGGDLMLWDEQAARANMLDPVALAPREGYPVVDCGGMPLRSLSRGPVGPVVTVDVPATANLAVSNTGSTVGLLYLNAGTHESLIRFDVPATPVDKMLTSARLVLTGPSGAGIDAHSAHSAWAQPAYMVQTDYWAGVPAGVLRGSSAHASGGWSIPIGDISANAGAPMSLRLRVDSGSASPYGRNSPTGVPVLRLTYALTVAPRVFTQHLRKAPSYYLTFWTDAAANTNLGTYKIGSTTLPLIAPAGSGLRRASMPFLFATSGDVDVTFTINDSIAYRLAGLGLASMDPGTYLPGHKTPVRVVVDDPTLALDSVFDGEQGKGERTVTIREVGA